MPTLPLPENQWFAIEVFGWYSKVFTLEQHSISKRVSWFALFVFHSNLNMYMHTQYFNLDLVASYPYLPFSPFSVLLFSSFFSSFLYIMADFT